MSKIVSVAALVLGAMLIVPAHAEIVDVQFSGNFSWGNGYQTGVYAPQQSGAAIIGSSGDQWNYFDTADGASVLNNTSGASSGVTLSFTALEAYTLAGAQAQADPFSATPTANLMQGYLDAKAPGEISFSFSGLAPNANYSLYVYSSSGGGTGRGVTLTATGAPEQSNSNQTTAGVYILDDNYLLFQGQANAAGQIFVNEVGFSGEGDINGLQLEVAGVPEPSTWAMFLVGFAGLGVARFRRASKAEGAAVVA